MKHRFPGKTGWWFIVVAILVVGHAVVFYHYASRFTWSVLFGLILLLLLKHVGLFSSVYAVLRRRSRGST